MSQGANALSRDQGVSSSAADSNTTHRRRIEDDSNWLDASSSDYETTSDEDSTPTSHPPRISSSTPFHYISSTSSSQTLVEQGAEHEHLADRGRIGARYPTTPLISRVTNEWQKQDNSEKRSPYYSSHKGYLPPNRRRSPSPSCLDEMCDAGSFKECLDVVWSRMTIRVLVVWALACLLLWTVRWWSTSASGKYAQDGALRQAVQLKMSGGTPRGVARGRKKAWFGAQHENDFGGMLGVSGIRNQDWVWQNGRRMLIVGDVHGCSAPLKQLLQQTNFENGRDHLVFTGDLVAKGPDTAGVLDIARGYNASSVRGNHDDKLLLLHRDLDGPLRAMQTHRTGPMTGEEVHRKESELAASLSSEQIGYLQQCPLILDLGEIPGLAPYALVAHAGLVPGLELDKQDPSAIMNMRSIDLRTHTPSRAHAPETERTLKLQLGDQFKELPPPWNNKKNKHKQILDLNEKYVLPWARLWEEWQRNLKAKDRTLLMYGHDSLVGLVDGKWAVGLDTGCVKGGSLTALVLEMKGGKVRRSFESVKCEDSTKKAAKD